MPESVKEINDLNIDDTIYKYNYKREKIDILKIESLIFYDEYDDIKNGICLELTPLSMKKDNHIWESVVIKSKNENQEDDTICISKCGNKIWEYYYFINYSNCKKFIQNLYNKQKDNLKKIKLNKPRKDKIKVIIK